MRTRNVTWRMRCASYATTLCRGLRKECRGKPSAPQRLARLKAGCHPHSQRALGTARRFTFGDWNDLAEVVFGPSTEGDDVGDGA